MIKLLILYPISFVVAVLLVMTWYNMISVIRGAFRNLLSIPRTVNEPVGRWTSTTDSTTSTSSTHPPYEEGDYCDAEHGGVVSGRVEPRENVLGTAIEAARRSGYSIREVADALRALGSAGTHAAQAGRDFQEAIRGINSGIGPMSDYQIGRVRRVTIELLDGRDISIEDANVTMTIEQETLNHHSFGGRIDATVVVNEERNVNVEVNPETFFEAIRLIRED